MSAAAAPAPTVVQKYGGSSVAGPDRIRRVAAQAVEAARAGRRVVVVVSAMGKTTDGLLALARAVVPDPPRRELDVLVTAGERISMALLSMAVQELGQPAVSFTGSQSGIITDERHSDARIVEVRPTRILEALAQGKVVIVAGYQGVSRAREITSLGRGGSDTSAVALAAALGADCEIYSDVDGVWSADPRVVSDARRLDAVSYQSMQELAESGAKVLCAQAVEWARKAGIAIHARQTGTDGPGTRVGGADAGAPRGAVGVAGLSDLVRVALRGDPSALVAALARHACHPHWLSASADGADALVRRANCPDLGRICAALRSDLGDALSIDEQVAAASAVGPGVGEDIAAIAAAQAACAPLSPLGLHTAPMRVTVLVRPPALDDAVRALHRALIAAR